MEKIYTRVDLSGLRVGTRKPLGRKLEITVVELYTLKKPKVHDSMAVGKGIPAYYFYLY